MRMWPEYRSWLLLLFALMSLISLDPMDALAAEDTDNTICAMQNASWDSEASEEHSGILADEKEDESTVSIDDAGVSADSNADTNPALKTAASPASESGENEGKKTAYKEVNGNDFKDGSTGEGTLADTVDGGTDEDGLSDTGDVLPEDIPSDGVIPEGIWIAGMKALTYDGTNQVPAFRLYHGRVLLREKADYTVSCKNNQKAYALSNPNAPTAADQKKAPRLTITLKGCYSGKQTIYFGIGRLSIEDREAFSAYWKKSGNKQTPVLSWNGKVLKEKTDYTVSAVDGKTVLYGTGNFTGRLTLEDGEVSSPNTILMSKVKTPSIPAQVYLGKAYTIRDLKSKTGGVFPFTLSYGNEPLDEGTEYRIVRLLNAENPGTATILLRGTNTGENRRFIGEKRITFRINPCPMTAAGISVTDGYGNADLSAEYHKGGTKPDVSVRYGDVLLREGIDYQLSFSGNKTYPATKAKVTITGKGNYSGKRTQTFTVTRRSFSKGSGITAVAADKVVGKRAGQYQTQVSVYDAEGVLLKAGADYEKELVYLQGENILTKAAFPQAGEELIVRITGKGGYSAETLECTYKILAANESTDIKSAAIRIKDQVCDQGKPIQILSQEQFSQCTFGRTKTALTLSTDGGTTGELMVVPGSYVNNRKTGTARVTFMGINGYSGSKTVSFKIKAKSAEEIWEGVKNHDEEEGGTDEPAAEQKLLIGIGDTVLKATLADNSSTEALKSLLAKGSIPIDMHDYAGFEKVGTLPESLPQNNEQMKTDYGDLILYQGNQFVIYYGQNSYSLTRLGHIDDITKAQLKQLLGEGNVRVVLSLGE